MRRLAPFFLLGIALLFSLPLRSQEAEAEEPHAFRHHRLALLLGHTHVPARQQKDGLFIPSYGLDYEYWWTERWGIGLHSDLELQTFVVERRETDEELEREYPLVLTLDLLVRPWRGLVLEIGPGYEFEPRETLFLVRIGAGYEFELPGHWDISPTLFYDSRTDAFDTYSLGIVVGKRF